MARNVKSGKNGKIEVDSATINDVANIRGTNIGQHSGEEYASSSTAGQKFELAGHSKKAGSFEVLSDVLDAALLGKIGTAVGLIIFSDATTKVFNGTALLKAGETTIDVEAGGIERTTIDWAEAEL